MALGNVFVAETGKSRVQKFTNIGVFITMWKTCAPPCPSHCVADLTEDCAINVDDLLGVINAWGPCP